MNISMRVGSRKLRYFLLAVLASVAVLLPLVVAPASAHAAATTTTRIANFAAGPATVVKGKSITYSGLVQRPSGKAWVKTGAVTVRVYFDADGSAPKKLVRTLKTNSSGSFKATAVATVTGKWSVALPAQANYKASSTSVRVVKVVPATKPTSAKPASKWNCPSWAPIKGNAPSKIYHLKNQRFYAKTTPEICFTTEAAAKKAGYRKSKV
ncbi:sunset domain-containing protein [Arthrobacter sp. Sr24]